MSVRRSIQSVTCYVPSLAYKGYTLFAPIVGCGVWLIDMDGQFVHHWEVSNFPSSLGKLLPDGNLLFAEKLPEPIVSGFGGIGGKLLELDWDGTVVWEYVDPYMHHDFERLPNGNTMTLRYVPVPSHIAAKIQGGIPGTEREGVMWADAFQEISPEGKVVWEWISYENLDPESYPICPLDERKEWTHTNTCFVLPDGNILTSFCNLNTIAIIEKNTGKIKWQWGNGLLGHPHDPKMLENGNILVFDNGAHRLDNSEAGLRGKYNFSRVLEVNPETCEIVWEYRDRSLFHFIAPFISGSQRLPNGNTLICDGPTGRFFEVTHAKELVWEYISPFYNERRAGLVGFGNSVFRAHRYGVDYAGLKDKDLNPERYELTLRENPIWKYEQKTKANSVQARLADLGY